jgi:hypothetical protein
VLRRCSPQTHPKIVTSSSRHGVSSPTRPTAQPGESSPRVARSGRRRSLDGHIAPAIHSDLIPVIP